jgi:hypothetical protein
MQEALETLGVRKTRTKLLNPQSYDMVETTTIEKHLKKLVSTQ